MYLEYFFTKNDLFFAEICPFSHGVCRCITKWKKSGRKVIFSLFFTNFSKSDSQTRKVGKWVLRGGHNISKNSDFPSFRALARSKV